MRYLTEGMLDGEQHKQGHLANHISDSSDSDYDDVRRATAQATTRLLTIIYDIATRPRRGKVLATVRAELVALSHLGTIEYGQMTERQLATACSIGVGTVCGAIERVRERYANGQETRLQAGQGSWQRRTTSVTV